MSETNINVSNKTFRDEIALEFLKRSLDHFFSDGRFHPNEVPFDMYAHLSYEMADHMMEKRK